VKAQKLRRLISSRKQLMIIAAHSNAESWSVPEIGAAAGLQNKVRSADAVHTRGAPRLKVPSGVRLRQKRVARCDIDSRVLPESRRSEAEQEYHQPSASASGHPIHLLTSPPTFHSVMREGWQERLTS
jgi:hypothetical protein